MTIIARDGHTLAADKMANINGYKCKVTKIEKFEGKLLFSSGDFDVLKELFLSFKSGADPDKWPSIQSDKDAWGSLGVIMPDKTILRYDRRPYPFKIEEKFFAVGSGRDYALAAMHLNYIAEKAVEVACHFCPNCALGIDTLTLGD